MNTTRSIRRAAALAGLALAVAAPAVRAQPLPPGNVSASSCTSQAAGYTGLAGNKGASGWVYNGALRVVTCLTRGTGGKIWATSRLDGPYDPANGTHDRFTGQLTVRLQGCATRTATTLETDTGTWTGSTYDVAIHSGSRFYFSTIYTGNHANSYAKYRIWVRSVAGAVVGRGLPNFVYSLSVNGFESGVEDFYTACSAI